jgi:mono/diheme cytochrome c family protein
MIRLCTGLIAAVGAAWADDLWTDRVLPILHDRCVSCHGPAKAKGGLRLDSQEHLLAGGHSGAAVVPGDPEASPLWRLIILPLADPDRMPATGDPLTPDQIAVIRSWITAAGVAAPPVLLGADLAVLAAGLDAADPQAVAALVATGAVVSPVAPGAPLLAVSLAHIRSDPQAALAALAPVAAQIAWLDASGAALGDRHLASLPALPRLVRLRLDRTAVTDAGLQALHRHPHLAVLHLAGTAVSDAAVPALSGCPALTTVGLWQTRCTDAGVAVLRARRLLVEDGAGAP